MTIKNNIQDLIEKLKKDPMDFNARLALIQYYCIDANWDKALKAIQQYLKLNPKDQDSKILLQYNIECEINRLNKLQNFDQFNDYTGHELKLENKLMTDYLSHSVNEQSEQEFIDLIESQEGSYLLEADNNYTGVWVDTDFRFNHLLEIFVQNQYFVLQIDNILELTIRDNQYLTDILWRRAEITLKDQRNISCFIPARYPIFESEATSDEIKLNKTTQWEMMGNLSIAYGQKTYTNGEIDIGLLDIKRLKLIED